MTTFAFETTEIEFGNFAMTGDWVLTIATDDDGLTFKLVDASSAGGGVDRDVHAAIQGWIESETAPRLRKAGFKSLIRQAYEDSLPADPLFDEDHPDDAAPLWRSWRAA